MSSLQPKQDKVVVHESHDREDESGGYECPLSRSEAPYTALTLQTNPTPSSHNDSTEGTYTLQGADPFVTQGDKNKMATCSSLISADIDYTKI